MLDWVTSSTKPLPPLTTHNWVAVAVVALVAVAAVVLGLRRGKESFRRVHSHPVQILQPTAQPTAQPTFMVAALPQILGGLVQLQQQGRGGTFRLHHPKRRRALRAQSWFGKQHHNTRGTQKTKKTSATPPCTAATPGD